MPQVICQMCAKEFIVKPSHQKNGFGKYCSIACRSDAQRRGKYFNCYTCGEKVYKSPKAIERSKSKHYFCNKSCSTKWRNAYYSQEKHANWKYGASIYRKILSNTNVELKCIDCGNKDKRVLVAHHLDKNRNNNNTNNLCWLCMNCHFIRHNSKDMVTIV